MENENKLQDKELNRVSGGEKPEDNDIIKCGKCHKRFGSDYANKKQIKGGCNKEYIYQCKYCGTWVDEEGNVYNQ